MKNRQSDVNSSARNKEMKTSKKDQEAFIEALKSADEEATEKGIHEYLRYRKQEAKKKRRRKLLVIAIILLALDLIIIGLWHYIVHEENTLEVSFYHLSSDNVDSGFRIVQLSDLHLHEFGENNSELVEWVRRLNPDIIVITGDMNNHFDDDTHLVTDLCSQLVEIADVYYVMGNHEWVDHIDRHTSIKKDIVATGVTMLQNNYIVTELNGNRVVIGGLVNEVSNFDKYEGPEFMAKFTQEDGFKLLLVHYPEYFLGKLNDYTIDLAMCGHTHGGVIRLPVIGGLYSSDQGSFPELYEGIQVVDGGSVVVVSRGLGGEGVIPRINNNPEIVVVDVNWY